MQYERRVKFDRLYKTHTTLGMNPGICPHRFTLLSLILFSVFSNVCFCTYYILFMIFFFVFSAALMFSSSSNVGKH